VSTERDLTRIVRSWLSVDEHESPDRVLDNVFALLDATPQRPAWWPARRIADMNTYAKLAIAAAAVVVVALVGYNLMPAGDGRGGTPTASPSPSPSASASPSSSASASLPPEPSPVEGAIPPAGRLEVGRHAFSQNGIDFSLELASPDWASSGVAVAPDGGNLTKGVRGLRDPSAVWMLFWSIDGVYSDPCGGVAAPPVSPSSADLASAVATLPGIELVSGRTDVTVGGRAAKHIEITIPDSIPCSPEQFLLWYDDVTCASSAPCARFATATGETNQVWIVEVDGTHVWIEAETYAGAPPEIEQTVQAIIDSIQFE
jgi:hypothetical protein